MSLGMTMTMDMGAGLSPSAVLADVTSGTFRMITADGDATIYASGLDLSGYVGRKIVVTDSSGNEAIGYGHSADEAESTTELMTNGDNESAMASFDGSSAIRCTASQDAGQAHGGSNSMKLTQNVGSADDFAYQFLDSDESMASSGSIIKASAWSYTPSGQGSNISEFWVKAYAGTWLYVNNVTTTDSWVEHERNYVTINEIHTQLRANSNSYNDGDVQYWDDISILRVDSLGTTALQLRNARTGSTRNLASKDAGFDPNDVSKVEVYV
jgi:hypothetical protein